MSTSVALTKVYKRYGDVEVIHGIDLQIDPGEFVVFVGPSGCGKSTLLRMIAGLEPISGGDLLIDNQRMNEMPAAKRGIAMVFQSYALYPHMSVYQNLAFGLETAKVPKPEIQQRVQRAAEILRIEPLLKRRPKQLSGGQRQRVAIGRAIVREPRIFLFDEPLSNLDAELRVQMRVEIAKLHNDLGNTMIYVTHDQVEAMTMADKIVVLQGGIVEQVGAPLQAGRLLQQQRFGRGDVEYAGQQPARVFPQRRRHHVQQGDGGALGTRQYQRAFDRVLAGCRKVSGDQQVAQG